MSFDRLAHCYKGLELAAFGRLLEQCRFRFVDDLKGSGRILILGEGDGRFLDRLLTCNERAQVDCLEQSREMIESAQRRIEARHDGSMERVRFIRSRVQQWEFPHDEYDGIVTHFFLDCFERGDLEDVVPRIGASGKADCRWLFSDFRIPDSGWRRYRARLLTWALYQFFHVAVGMNTRRLEDPGDLLNGSKYALVARDLYSAGLLSSELWRRVA